MIDHATGAHHCDAVGQRHDLAQFVGDQDDGPALIPERTEDAEEVVDLLRREHARGLVQDQDVGTAIERLQDLDPLLKAHGQRAHDRVGVDIEPVLALQPLELLPGLAQGRAQQVALLDAEHHVLQHGEGVHEHEVLVDHADTVGDGVLRPPDGDRRTVHPDFAAVGLVVAVDDAHQGRLAGAVLADDAVDRARGNGGRHIVVGVHRAEPLLDADDFQRGRT